MTAPSVTEQWVDAPFRRFVGDAALQSGVLLLTSGRVVAQFGFSSAEDVMSVCALASAINASSSELGRQIDGKPFRELHHSGRERQLYMAQCNVAGTDYLFVGVFDGNSSLGVVGMYFEEFAAALQKSRAGSDSESLPSTGDLEGDLNRSLDALFGPIE